ncbi:MAG: Maf family protein [Coriobacteriales bacterium]|jgi:septum formation protein|nr:Maf family protein [Coriobacteriales bacterium]
MIILASGSPRRLEILLAHGLEPDVVLPDIDEDALIASWPAALSPEELVLRLALHKARAVYEQMQQQAGGQIQTSPSKISAQNLGEAAPKVPDTASPEASLAAPGAGSPARSTALILAADTVVYKESAGILGKPANQSDAVRMLQALNNTEHQVITGVALIEAATGQEASFTDTTTVRFNEYSLREILDYLAAEPPFDKAGSYAIQGLWGKHVMWLRGDYENVMGLPFYRLTGFIA